MLKTVTAYTAVICCFDCPHILMFVSVRKCDCDIVDFLKLVVFNYAIDPILC